MQVKKIDGIPSIDVEMVVFRFKTGETNDSFAIDTASKVGVEPQIETTDAIKLIKGSSGKLLSQKPKNDTITGHQITLTDNVFVPEVVVLLQGGSYTVNDTDDTSKYVPPVSGSTDKGKVFETDFYSAVYDESGEIVKYQKITYPNCKGSPITINMEDNVFFIPEYTIMSAPKSGQAPYVMEWVNELPELVTTVTSEQGTASVSETAQPKSTKLAKMGTSELEEY